MSVLVVGSIALDTVTTPYGTRERVLGGAASHFAASASYFCPVSMVGVIGNDFPQEHLDFFVSRDINIEGIESADGQTFAWRGRYSGDMNSAETLETHLNVFENFDPKLPAAAKKAEVVMLGNIHPNLQLSVLDQVDKPRLVAADTMNFWIEGTPDELRKVLARIDILSINDDEARQLAGVPNLVKAARAIHAMGPKYLVIKRGEYGAMVFFGDTIMAAPAYPLEVVRDPTGAGDTFAGGFVGTLAQQPQIDANALRQALFAGSVMASFVVEEFSLDRIRKLDRKELLSRYEGFVEMTRFDNRPLALRDS